MPHTDAVFFTFNSERILIAVLFSLLSAPCVQSAPVQSITIPRDPGPVATEVQNYFFIIPELNGLIVDGPLDLDFVFTDFKHLEVPGRLVATLELFTSRDLLGFGEEIPTSAFYSDENGSFIAETDHGKLLEGLALYADVHFDRDESLVTHGLHFEIPTLSNQPYQISYSTLLIFSPLEHPNGGLMKVGRSTAVPEPTSLALFGISALGMVVRHRRKQKQKTQHVSGDFGCGIIWASVSSMPRSHATVRIRSNREAGLAIDHVCRRTFASESTMTFRFAVLVIALAIFTEPELVATPITIIAEGMLVANGTDNSNTDGSNLRITLNMDDQTAPTSTDFNTFYSQILFDNILPVEVAITNRPNAADDQFATTVAQQLLVENGHSAVAFQDFAFLVVEFNDPQFMNGDDFGFRVQFQFGTTDVFPGTDPPQLSQMVGVNVAFTNVVMVGDPPRFSDIPAGTFSVTSVPEPNSLAIFGIGALGMVVRRRRKQKLKTQLAQW